MLDPLALRGDEIHLERALGIGSQEQINFPRLVLDQLVFAISNEFLDSDSLAIGDFLLIAVHHRKLCALIGIEGFAVKKFPAEENLLRRGHDAIGTVRGDTQDQVEFRYGHLEMLTANIATKESGLLVVAQLDVLSRHRLLVDGLDPGDLGSAGVTICVFFDQSSDILDGCPLHVLQLLFDRLDLGRNVFNILSILLDIVSRYPTNPNFEKPLDVFIDHGTNEELFVFRHPLLDFIPNGILCLGLFDSFIDSLLDEDLLQSEPMLLVQQLLPIKLEL